MSQIRILLAGSNNYRWVSYQKRLHHAGYAVKLTFSSVECLFELRDFAPQVLIMDPNLPFGGGDGVLAVRDEEKSLQDNLVMILAAHCDSGLLYRISRYKIDDMVSKSILAPFLQWRLERLMELNQEDSTFDAGTATGQVRQRTFPGHFLHMESASNHSQ